VTAVGANGPAPTIALVEDSAADEALALRALKRSGVTNPIVVLRDGVQAVEYFLGAGSEVVRRREPHLVLLDLKLPRLDGFQVLERLRGDDRTRTMPVVVLTSSDEQRDLVAAYRLGANSYIRKPTDFAEYAEAVSQLSHYWLALNCLPASWG
jgi:two-component system response regulator